MPQQLCVPCQVAQERLALMWMSTDAEQDLCASEATNSRKLKSIGNTHIDLENEKLKVGKYLQSFLATSSAFWQSPLIQKLTVSVHNIAVH